MRLPNGKGSITKLSGKRRNPYSVRITYGWDIDEKTGKVIQKRKQIGTYRTKGEAVLALSEYLASPYDVENKSITLQQLYERWFDEYQKKLTSKSSERTITMAWSYCSQIADMPVREIRARHIKGVMEQGFIIGSRGSDKGKKKYATANTKARIKSLMNLLFDYAVEYELTDRNYARTFDVPDDILDEMAESYKEHVSFTDDELVTLWNNSSNRYIGWVLIQSYMGWRPQEMVNIKLSDIKDGFIIGGLKTDAGKNRMVPIHPAIEKLILGNVENATLKGCDYLLCEDGPMTYNTYKNRIIDTMAEIGITGHRAHDPRKTFTTLAKRSKMDEYAIKYIVGHKIKDITESIYTDRDISWLMDEIKKIKPPI